MGLSPYLKLRRKAPVTFKHPGAVNSFEQEEVEFTFQKIEVTDTGGGKSAQDSWATTDGDGNGDGGKSGDGDHGPKHSFPTFAFSYAVQAPVDFGTGKPTGKRPWSPAHRKCQLVVPACSVLVPKLKDSTTSKKTIASIVLTSGQFGRDKLHLSNVQVTHFVPHGGRSGQFGDYIAFEIEADMVPPRTRAA